MNTIEAVEDKRKERGQILIDMMAEGGYDELQDEIVGQSIIGVENRCVND